MVKIKVYFSIQSSEHSFFSGIHEAFRGVRLLTTELANCGVHYYVGNQFIMLVEEDTNKHVYLETLRELDQL